MARHAAPRTVECYHCRRRFPAAERAQSTSCPHCHQRVVVADVIVTTLQSVTRIQTCGRVVVQPAGRVIAKLVQGQEGVEVLGTLEADVISGGLVSIGAKARWKGDCQAPVVTVKLGAKILGDFAVPGHVAAGAAAPVNGSAASAAPSPSQREGRGGG